VLLGHQRVDARRDLSQLLRRVQPVGAIVLRLDAGIQLLLETSKNSSAFALTIAANLRRSSSGLVGSAASSSTRALNPSQLSSRLR
jgi:hypothetical protein